MKTKVNTSVLNIQKVQKKSRPIHAWKLANQPAGEVEILFATSTTDPQPFA
jgi:hypothetical protein